jgi:putative membrane protein
VPPEPAPPPAPEPLTDEQIAAVADAANTGEIDQAKLAQKKAKNGQVKKLAAMILTHHTAIKQKMTKVLAKAKITPATSPTSTQLTDDGTKLLETLKTAEGADFDKAYVDAQVDEHKKVLETLDAQLIANAKNAELKAELEDVRTKVEAHLKAAQDAQTALAAAPADKGAATPAATGGAKGTGAAPKKAAESAPKAPAPAK